VPVTSDPWMMNKLKRKISRQMTGSFRNKKEASIKAIKARAEE